MSKLDVSNVQLLIVEDNHRYLEQLIAVLREDYGYQHIDTARNEEQTRQKLDQGDFHIIVADMRLEGRGDGGFTVLQEVNHRNIASLVIIMTANDMVGDCRKAFKMDAWDYISKNIVEEEDPLDVLHQSIQEAITYFNRRGNQKDRNWIADYIEMLLQNYNGKYIAVLHGDVVESADTETELKARLREQKLPLFLPIIQKIGNSIADLIRLGESKTLEFKSTLQWDVRRKTQNTDLRFEVLKTIVAFLNFEGGILLIGVEDDGTIFGLAKDLKLLGRQNTLDGFELQLLNLITDRINPSVTRLIDIRFEVIEGKDVCAIEVKKGTEPVFLKGKKSKEFYIRPGNKSITLDVEQTYHYIRKHWG